MCGYVRQTRGTATVAKAKRVEKPKQEVTKPARVGKVEAQQIGRQKFLTA